MKCLDRWMELQFALEALDISTEEAKGLWAPIAAIFHLGAAGISVGNIFSSLYCIIVNPSFNQCPNSINKYAIKLRVQ